MIDNKVPPILEINFNRLLDVTQKMASGVEPKGWLFAKRIELLILYGSETGTAQEMAEGIYRIALRKLMIPEIMSMNNINIEKLVSAKLVVFVASTTGQGDDPENMKQFFQALWKQRSNKILLKSVQFGVIGLGDSSYQKFNYAAKRLNNLLVHLGAKQLLKLGLADDQHELGTDYVGDNWINEFFTILHNIYPDSISKENNINLLPPKYKLTHVTSDNSEKIEVISNVNNTPFNHQKPFNALLSMNEKKCSPDHFQDVRLIEFDISYMKLSYKPGDVLMVQPQNTDENVEKFLSIMELDGSKQIRITPNKQDVEVPPWCVIPTTSCTLKECVKRYLDIQSIPKRFFFELLSFFTSNNLEKEKFIEFASSYGKQELYNYCNRPKRTILEVLNDFPHIKGNIPIAYLFDLIPPIKARAYSIASSHFSNVGKVQILVAVVQYNTNLKAKRFGLCSNWLASLSVGDEAYLSIKSGSLKFPNVFLPDPRNVMMIAPGTGCAPFRAFINESQVAHCNAHILMIFGCRGQNTDYFFKEEWKQLSTEDNFNLLCAFSRDQDHKIYVQHVIKKHAADIWKFISNENTDIFYAGNAKRIPIDVHEAMLFVCEEEGNMTSEEAKLYFKKNIEKRYQTECWA